MSGGAYDYATFKVTEMADSLRGRDTDPLRRAFADHLRKVADAMYAVEWEDSGDGHPDPDGKMREVLAPGAELEAATAMARQALAALERALAPSLDPSAEPGPPL